MSQVNATHFIGVNDPIQDEAAVSEIAFDDPIDVNENDFNDNDGISKVFTFYCTKSEIFTR